MDLLDLRGPDFLFVYAVSFGVAVVLGLVLRRTMRGPQAGEVPREASKLDPTEVAYLAGGPRLAINTALASLYRQDSIRVTAGTRSLQAVRPPGDSATAMEQGIYRYISTATTRQVREVHKNFPVDLARRRPESLGLTLSAAQRVAAAVASSLPLLLLMLLGVAKVAVGLSRDRPVGILVFFLIASFAVCLAFLTRAPRTTVAGDRTLVGLRSVHAALRSTAGSNAGSLAPAEVALAMGLFGPAVLMAGEMDDFRKAIHPPGAAGTSGSSCGSGCGSGGSSCSGGGSSCGGGGGCGGCGGGGGD